MRRRTVILGGPAALLLAARSARARPAAAPQPTLPPPAERAVRAHEAFLRALTVADPSRPDERLLTGEGRTYAYLWPFSQSLLAALALAGMPQEGGRYVADVQGYLRTLAIYWEPRSTPPGYASYPPPPYGDGGDLYYDDNAWVGVPLIQYRLLTGDPTGVIAARRVFDFLLSGWDDDPEHAAPGGIFWVIAAWNRNRNTVSTAPAALIGLHLYELTGDRLAWDWAVRMVEWLDRHLLSPEGLYWDHIRLDGGIDHGIFAYNQGAMIAVSLAQERLTGDAAYGRRARRIADAMLAVYAAQGPAEQPPAFTAIFARYLLQLWGQTGDPRYRRFVEEYAVWAWQSLRDPATDLYHFERQGLAGEIEQAILGQSTIVQINALLSWPPERLRLLA